MTDASANSHSPQQNSAETVHTVEADEQKPTRLVLIRHGESQVTVDRVLGGFRTCSGLSELGVQQAQRLNDRLATTEELGDTVLIASNFPRAIETAELISAGVGSAILRQDAGFGEHDPGPDLDGMKFDAYVERFGSPNWGGDPHFVIFPGGETTAEFHVRVGSALSRTLAEFAGRRIVISCHGGVVDAVFRQLLRTAPTGLFDLWTTNTSITEFVLSSESPSHEPRWRLVRYNDAAHLAGLPASTSRADSQSPDAAASTSEPAPEPA